MQAGQWNLQLSLETPKSIRDLLDYFGHVFAFDTAMRRGIADATMISTARWGGVVRIRSTPWQLGGANMITWLGDEDGKGPIIETANNGGGAGAHNLTTWITNLVPAAVAVGTITNPGGTLTNSYQWVTPRQAIDNVCSILGAEYRVNRDATIDAAPVGNSAIFKQTPTAVVMRRSSGRDLAVTGLPVTQLDISIDSEEYFGRALVKDSTNAWTGSTGSAVPYKDLRGNTVSMTKAFIQSTTSNTGAAAQAANLVSAGQALRQQAILASDEFDIGRDVQVGDYLYVYDEDSNLVDTTTQVRYRGEVMFPVKVRALAMTWPFEKGMSVWYRDKNAVWTDLTGYVAFEPPGVQFEVGAVNRALLTSP